MNRLEIFERLGLPPGGILIRGYEIADWGKTLIIHADYIGTEERLPFRLFFENCTEIHWLADVDRETEEEADVLAIFFQPKDTAEFFNMRTELFEVTALYSQLTIAQDWLGQG